MTGAARPESRESMPTSTNEPHSSSLSTELFDNQPRHISFLYEEPDFIKDFHQHLKFSL